MILHITSHWINIGFWVLVITERIYNILWSTKQAGVELPLPYLFSYISQMHDSFRLIICVNNTDTSVVIYVDFKENWIGPQYQAYIDTTPLNKTYTF